MCVVVRKEGDDLKVYSHVATGNYNEKTAKLYSDISYLTAKQKIGMDLVHIFNILSGISTPDDKLQKVFYAPVNLRKRMIKNIEREIDFAKKGKRAEIFLKLNSINDPEIINKLYEAADKGVEVYIISRGITSIVARKNIYIKSIVGRFLEHSRIYCFRNGGHPEYYISSADMLTRNLSRRVETLIMINDQESITKLKNIIDVFKNDKKNSFKMNEDGNYSHLKGDFDCHQWFIDNAENDLRVKLSKKEKK
jgi:polyphosphate kinase